MFSQNKEKFKCIILNGINKKIHMVKLNKKEYSECTGSFQSEPNQVLRNGDKGYYIEDDILTLVICCNKCGDYTKINLPKEDVLNLLLYKN